MGKYPKLYTTDLAQEMYTPKRDAQKILQYIPKMHVIYEMCAGEGHMVSSFREMGYNVVTDEKEKFDVVITNPPWRNHKDFVEKAISFNKPFAFLLRLEHLGGVRSYELFSKIDIKILIPKKRINFITPKMREGKNVGGSPFHSIWVTYGLPITDTITYIE